MNIAMRHTNKRAGRKRLIGRERYNNGRTKPEDGPTPAIVREIIYGAIRKAQDPLLRTELGRMRLEQFINDAECAAGMTLAEIVATYDRIKGIPPRHVRSLDYMGGYGKSLGAEPDERTIDRAVSRHDGAMRSLGVCRNAVVDVVIYDQLPAGELDRKLVKFGLCELAKHLGLTSAGK